MKKLIMIVLTAVLLMPSIVFAKTESMNFIETLESKQIEPANKDYTETDDQVTLYLFRWSSCSHCLDLLNYLNELSVEHGSKFKLRSYETSTNADNDKLRQDVADYFNETGTGVPLLIIGENSFYGFDESFEEKILTAINNEYEKSERFDIIETLVKKANEKNPNDALYVILPILAIVVIYFVINKAKKEA